MDDDGATVDFPPWCMTDNEPTAKAVTNSLHLFQAICAVHVLYIAIRIACFHPWPMGMRSPRAVPDTHALPTVVRGLEALRAMAWAFQDEAVRAEWVRFGLGGPRHRVLHVDSNAKWGSTSALCDAGIALRDDLAVMKGRLSSFPELPTDTQWEWIERLVDPLAKVDCSVDVLQADDSRAAQIVPVIRTLIHQLENGAEDIGKVLARLLNKYVCDHFKKSWVIPSDERGAGAHRSPMHDILARSGISNYWELCEVASLMHCGSLEQSHPHLGLADREVRARLERFCTRVDKYYNPELHQELPPVGSASHIAREAAEQPVIAARRPPTNKKRRKNVRGEAARSGFADALPGNPSAAGSTDPRLSNAREIIAGQVRTLLTSEVLPGTRDGKVLCAWWYSPSAAAFGRLRPAARLLNQFPASQGKLERRFGKASSLWREPRRFVSKGRQQLLNCNAWQLGMAGYSGPQPETTPGAQPDDADDDDGVLSEEQEPDEFEVVSEPDAPDDVEPGAASSVPGAVPGLT